MYVWLATYIFFVLLLITIIYMTVYSTYTYLHKEASTNEGFTSTSKCLIHTSDALAHPWENKTTWVDACTTQDANNLVAGIEVLANIANVANKSDIPNSNLQRLYFPIGPTDSLRIEFSKNKYDVYPTHVYLKKDFQLTLTNEKGDVTKLFSQHAALTPDEQTLFKNGKIVVSAIASQVGGDKHDTKARAFTLQGQLQSKMNSTFCLTSKQNSIDVIASECTPDYTEQQWKRDEKGRIVSSTNMCLHVGDDNKIVQATCDDHPRQKWSTDSLNRLLAGNSTTACMQPSGDSVVEGASLVMKDCNQDLIQQWLL